MFYLFYVLGGATKIYIYIPSGSLTQLWEKSSSSPLGALARIWQDGIPGDVLHQQDGGWLISLLCIYTYITGWWF